MDDALLTTVSSVCGYLSFTIWLFAQLPQIIENHLNQSVAGVNVLFLSSWVAGDITNLVGCLLTRALPFQTLIATYYCFIDVVLCFQFYYYTRIFPYHKTPHNLLQSPNMLRHPSHQRSPHEVSNLLGSTARKPRRSSILNILSTGLLAKRANAAPISQFVAVSSGLWLSSDAIGKISAWTCTAFYLSARLPQIRTNFKNKSTSGISPYLFIFAMAGNSFYTASLTTDLFLLYRNHDKEVMPTFWDQLPFLMGSGGTVLFDCMILCQCWYYKANNTNRRAPKHHRSQPSVAGGFQKPDWYVNNFVYEDEEHEEPHYQKVIESLAPHHYIVGSASSNANNLSSRPSSIINSFSKSMRSNSSSIHSPVLQTHLIPSIINSYSSVSKKMANDKTPFSPSDFLNDGFHVPIENSSFSLNNAGSYKG
ncbi:hypothetical protein CANTEDRAFT_114936 [Yamadazyma tenuis ATCC 10573]|uniref:PQ-loop-domain-containing protein n=2 Tax=Candida tenuis TaxID=2315449 RepID=G3BAW9_CANTC|nr:uncharacterized protein CANTEDRAFT_114936 [Yamadazyma tenuis ATCC 10573]EGV61474.1 hypothetical protein CANTEDRAFT_114936 [Yamadazyma tenuis ATCC 10573]